MNFSAKILLLCFFLSKKVSFQYTTYVHINININISNCGIGDCDNLNFLISTKINTIFLKYESISFLLTMKHKYSCLECYGFKYSDN